jgi:hypothetical protein
MRSQPNIIVPKWPFYGPSVLNSESAGDESGSENMVATAAQDTDNVFADVGEAMRNAAENASERATADAAKVKDALAEAGPKAMRSLTSLAYSTGYVCSYGVTYAAVFVTRMLPSDNAFMKGCKAGGKAAMDELNRS